MKLKIPLLGTYYLEFWVKITHHWCKARLSAWIMGRYRGNKKKLTFKNH